MSYLMTFQSRDLAHNDVLKVDGVLWPFRPKSEEKSQREPLQW